VVALHSSDLRLREILAAAEHTHPHPEMRCAMCDQGMESFDVELESSRFGRHSMELDLCKSCQVFWFDPGESSRTLDAQEDRPEAVPEAPMSTGKFGGPRERLGGSAADLERWEYVLAVFGLPVEYEAPELRQRPVVIWGLLMVLLTTWIATLVGPIDWIHAFGFVPAEALRWGGITFISSGLLHIGLVHLAGNAYFLWLFGDNVEDVLGPSRLAMLILGAHLMGLSAHGLWGGSPEVPLVGASGAISGLLTFYALRFRRARIALFGPWTFFRFRAVPAWLYLCLWVALQVVILVDQLGGGGTSALAHFGGAFAGLCAWVIWGRSKG